MDDQTRLKVLLKPMSSDQPFKKSSHLIPSNRSIHLTNLCTDAPVNTTSVLFVCLTNAVGDGPLSYAQYFHLQLPAPTDRTIHRFNVSVLSSSELAVQWTAADAVLTPVAYRVRWQSDNQTNDEQSLIVASNESSIILNGLIPYTFYKIRMHAFNIHGDGPMREAELVQTEEDGESIERCRGTSSGLIDVLAPGPVEHLSFSYVTLTSLRLDWQRPRSLNGILRSYDLTYDNRLSFTSSLNTSSTRVKTIKQRLSPTNTSLRIDELDPYQFYEFSLCACTTQCGPCIQKSIQTGPQARSPIAPVDLRINRYHELQWKSSIQSEYYLIEYSDDQTQTWKQLDRVTKSPYDLNANIFQSNKSIEFAFRLFAVNHIGISEASETCKYNFTSSFSSSLIFPFKLFSTLQTFLRTNQFFFYTLLALVTLLLLMFICVIITCCCCRMKLNKTKLLHSTHTLSSNLNNAESKQSLYTASTMLTPTARQLTLQRNRDSLALSDLLYNNFSSRSPPRPIPTPIVYDDLTSTKSLLTNTNNHPNQTSDDGQSNNDYPWYHALPQQLYTYMSNNHLTNRIHEENETDETDLSVAFNGAILMNNVPRSRAAVNGCSSFAL